MTISKATMNETTIPHFLAEVKRSAAEAVGMLYRMSEVEVIVAGMERKDAINVLVAFNTARQEVQTAIKDIQRAVDAAQRIEYDVRTLGSEALQMRGRFMDALHEEVAMRRKQEAKLNLAISVVLEALGAQ